MPTQPHTDRTLWLDLTGLIHAPGARPTGIPRVIASLLRHWRAAGLRGLRFCTIHSVRRAIVEIDPPPPDTSDGKPPAGRTSPRSLVQSASQLIPASMRSPLRRLAFRLAGPLACLGSRPVALGPADLLVSMGGTWIVHDGAAIVREQKEHFGFRHAVFLHDLIPARLPQFYPPSFSPTFRAWTTDALRAADLVLVNSRHTRDDVRAFCAQAGLEPPPVEVLRLGDDFAAGLVSLRSLTLPARPEFALSVGTVEARKNHLLLYHVWRRLIEERGPAATPLLVLAGAPGWRTGDLLYQIEHDPLTREHICLLPHTDDAELRWLYRHCLFTLYPSHYEGWGLPVGESLAAGKYVIASSNSSIPEVGGDLVGLHDPCDLPGCLALVRQALDPAWRAPQEERIRREYAPTSWGDFADQLTRTLNLHFGPLSGPASLPSFRGSSSGVSAPRR